VWQDVGKAEERRERRTGTKWRERMSMEGRKRRTKFRM